MLYPIVYDKKTYDFNNMGLGVLTDAKNVVVKKNINSADSLEFELLRTSDQWKYIKNENVVKADGQLYIIKLIDDGREQGGSFYCRVSATHIWWEIAENGTHITEVLAIGKSPQEIILEVFADIRYNGLSFQLLDDSALELLGLEALTTLTDIEMDDPTPILVLSQIIENIGGEIYIDNFKFALVKQLGHDTGIKFSIDKNVQSIERSSNSMGLVTRLYPSGRDKISISTVNDGIAYIDSPYINDYASPLIGAKDYPDIEDITALKERAEKEFSSDNYDRIDMPQVSYRCNVLELWKTKEYGNSEKINIGDYVRIYDKVLDIDVTVRVVEYNYYPYDPQKSLITLGNPPKTIVELLADLDKLNNNFESEVKEVVKIVQSEVFYETIIEVTREAVLAAEVIDASFAFLGKTFTQTLQTNLVPFICKPNLLYSNGAYSWIDDMPTYNCQSSMEFGNLWPLIAIEGARQRFIERHLMPGDLSRLNSAQVQPLIIDGMQMYFTSLKSFEFLTPIDPKVKYPDITDENAEMFKVYVRRVESEYVKQEFELELDSSLSTYNIVNRYGTGDLSGNGIGFFKKGFDDFSFLRTLRKSVGVLNAGTEAGIRLNDNAIPEFLDPSDGIWKPLTSLKTADENGNEPGEPGGGGTTDGITHILLDKLPTSQEQIDALPLDAIVLVYDASDPFIPDGTSPDTDDDTDKDFSFVIVGSSYTLDYLSGQALNFTIDWGDGTQSIVDSTNSDQRTHDYEADKEWTITVKNYASGWFYFGGDSQVKKVLTPLPKQVGRTDFEDFFIGCVNLETIPEKGLFVNCADVTTFLQSFQYCSRLIAVPAMTFSNNTKVTSFTRCFYDCVSITGNVPELWTRTNPTPSGYGCYYNVKLAANYSEIPSDWR